MRDKVEDYKIYPFNIPAVTALSAFELHPKVTYLVGENGAGKSTLLEAIAVAAGFNAEGGSKNFNFATRRSESSLHNVLRLVRGSRRPSTGYFLRAESFFNVATNIEALGVGSYGNRPLHEQSHGESFMALLTNRFTGDGFYLLDEPEGALSPARQLAFLTRLHHLVRAGSQFIVATHSPIALAYPDSHIYELTKGETPIALRAYEDTSTVRVAQDFLKDRQRWLERLLED